MANSARSMIIFGCFRSYRFFFSITTVKGKLYLEGGIKIAFIAAQLLIKYWWY